MELIQHEMAHLSAFRNLTDEEGIAEEVCLKFGETFDAAMTDEAWTRLKGALEAMRKDHGDDHDIVKVCRVIEDAHQAEEFTQMKGTLAAVVHPAGQMSVLLQLHYSLTFLLILCQMAIQIGARTPAHRSSERQPQLASSYTSDACLGPRR
jgi:hypothetical protein